MSVEALGELCGLFIVQRSVITRALPLALARVSSSGVFNATMRRFNTSPNNLS